MNETIPAALFGARVIRNASRWQYRDQDGGDGCAGTVRGMESTQRKVRYKEIFSRHNNTFQDSRDRMRHTVIVAWDIGKVANYDARDLLVVDIPSETALIRV